MGCFGTEKYYQYSIKKLYILCLYVYYGKRWPITQNTWIWITLVFFNFLFLGLTAAAAAAAAATNAAIAEAMKVKKIKLEAMSNYHASNNQHGADSENGDMNSSVGKFLCSLPVFKFTFSLS